MDEIKIEYITVIIWIIVLVVVLLKVKSDSEQRNFKIAVPSFFLLGSLLFILNFKMIGVFFQFLGFGTLCYMVYTNKKWYKNK
jgi:hypothetical protein